MKICSVTLVASAIVAFAAVGCTPGAADPLPPDPGGDSSGVPEASPEIEELRAIWFGREVDDPDAARETWRDWQQALTDCMAAEGVDYLPRPYSGDAPIREALYGEHDRLVGTRAYAERFGFGRWTMEEASEILTTYYEVNEPPDPNLELLSDADTDTRLRYLEAMFGPATPAARDAVLSGEPSALVPGEAGQYESADWEAGCDWRVDPQAGWTTLPEDAQADYHGIWARVAADPELAAATGRWSDCMQAAGIQVRTRDDVWEAADDVALPNPHGVRVDGVKSVAVDIPGEGTQQFTIPANDPDDLAAMIDREILVAVADFDCRQASDYDDVEARAVRREQLAWVHKWSDRLVTGDQG